MEDNENDLSGLPADLRSVVITHRQAREFGLRELVHRQNLSFLHDVEQEMWNMLALPGNVQPGLIMAVVEAVLSKELRKQARLQVLEANALRIASYKRTTQEQEKDIRQVYAMSKRRPVS